MVKTQSKMPLIAILSECIDVVADNSDAQCMGLLASVCRTTRNLLTAQIWYSLGRRVCGTEHWESGLKRWGELLDRESPSSFTGRMICPWTQTPPRLLDPFANTTALPTDERIAWRLRMDKDENEKRLVIDTQTLTGQGGYGYWTYDDPMGNINATHRILSRPPGDTSIAITPQLHDISAASASALFEHLNSTTAPVINNNNTYFFIGQYVDSDPLNCWHMHAGVAAAAFGDTHHDAGCIAFFAAHAPHRLLHVIHIHGEANLSTEIVVMRPAELWVLERWTQPASRLLYYGP